VPSWVERDKSLPFDSMPIEGMQNLDGNQIAEKYSVDWTRDKKSPLITFPSGVEREIILHGEENAEPHVYLFGSVELPYEHNHALTLAQDHNLYVRKVEDDGLFILNPASTRMYSIAYDNNERRMADIEHYPQHAMELMTGEIRATLPPLYSGEKKGTEAIAPVKYFTPDANWTWYASEFDGNDIFFVLVLGFEAELGYFSVTELESVRGAFRLPIERDKFYEPKLLRELQQQHNR
jgi:hypothetical protein